MRKAVERRPVPAALVRAAREHPKLKRCLRCFAARRTRQAGYPPPPKALAVAGTARGPLPPCAAGSWLPGVASASSRCDATCKRRGFWSSSLADLIAFSRRFCL